MGTRKATFGMYCGPYCLLEYAIEENKEDYEFYKRTKNKNGTVDLNKSYNY